MKSPDGPYSRFDSGVVVSGDCRPLRRCLRPVVWVILEEVALDAVVEGGRLVARTSARRVAEHLGLNPSTAAEALRVLGRRGLVSLERETGPAGRFGLSVYQLCPPAGLCVVQPCVAEPLMVSPSMVPPHMEESAMPSPSAKPPEASSRVDEREPGRLVVANPDLGVVASDPDASGATPGEGAPPRPGGTVAPRNSRHGSGQTALDLGFGSS